MKKQFRLGFTLVELLVVISIIGMLAGLLLPAVNAAREAGRRAVCMNNQSQLALAIINYDSAKSSIPPMRGEIGRYTVTSGNSTVTNINVASWIGFLLPYMEFNQLYQNLTNVVIHDGTDTSLNVALSYDRQLIRIKSLLCPSADVPEIDAGTHYVCNGGYQNVVAGSWTAATVTTVAAGSSWSTRRFDPGKLADAAFFDHRAGTNTFSTTSEYECKAKMTIDYISAHSGTGNVILLSENERNITADSGARWAYWNGATNSPLVDADGEERIAFCFPFNANYTTLALINTAMGSLTRLAESGADSTKWSYLAYNTPLNSDADAAYHIPAFINQGRGDQYAGYTAYRRARPASNHPGIVLAAFADRSVRPVNENMNKQTFVWLCQPNSGQVVSGDAF